MSYTAKAAIRHLLDDSLPAHGAPDGVRFGSKADMCSARGHVRFTPNSDRNGGHWLGDAGPERSRVKSAAI